jgi:hypothetical protein
MASWEGALAEIDRRTALGVGLGVATALIADPRSAALAAVGDETKIAEGVTARTLGEGPSIIPGFAKVRLRDITMQPGSSFALRPMMNSMVCHTLQGEMEIDQGERKFTAKKDHVWTCTKGMSEGASNKGSTIAVMRVTDLLET